MAPGVQLKLARGLSQMSIARPAIQTRLAPISADITFSPSFEDLLGDGQAATVTETVSRSKRAPRKLPQSWTAPEFTRCTTVLTTSASVFALSETAFTRSSKVSCSAIVPPSFLLSRVEQVRCQGSGGPNSIQDAVPPPRSAFKPHEQCSPAGEADLDRCPVLEPPVA